MAIGLGVRTTYNPDSANALIVSGVLDALSAGVLLYTGLVELLAHDFLFNRESESTFLPLRGGCSALGAEAFLRRDRLCPCADEADLVPLVTVQWLWTLAMQKLPGRWAAC